MKGETQGDFQEAPALQRAWREGAGWSGLGAVGMDRNGWIVGCLGPTEGLTQGVSDGIR